MKPPPSFLFFFFFLLLSSLQVSSHNGSIKFLKTIIVDSHGGGDFTEIQDAIDSVPSSNDKWIKIHITTGVYREKVNIDFNKDFILLEGEGAESTLIEWGDHSDVASRMNTAGSATFTSLGSNIVFKGITFKNLYEGTQMKQALAALIGGDKTSFYSCRFIGVQDTLCDFLGRHYFKDCYIEGAVDFIFGYGQSIYEQCTLAIVQAPISAGVLTAQGRSTESDPGGFVFKNCNVTGQLKTYLGRAWGPYSRVVFYQTFMADVIVPQGWDSWLFGGKQSQITYVESDCSGPGSDESGRVKWMKHLGDDDLMKFVDISYIDDGWLNQQP